MELVPNAPACFSVRLPFVAESVRIGKVLTAFAEVWMIEHRRALSPRWQR
jgi:hypothetical protein